MAIEIKIPEKQILLDHEKLTVYQAAIEFVIIADEVIEHLPRGRAYLSDQLQGAALSIALNIVDADKDGSKTPLIGQGHGQGHGQGQGSELCKMSSVEKKEKGT